jgi:hypothetical protein
MMADIWDIECRAFQDQCRQNATSVVDISVCHGSVICDYEYILI